MDKETAIAKLESRLSKKNLFIDAVFSAIFCGVFLVFGRHGTMGFIGAKRYALEFPSGFSWVW